jgi:hypothetical protein
MYSVTSPQVVLTATTGTDERAMISACWSIPCSSTEGSGGRSGGRRTPRLSTKSRLGSRVTASRVRTTGRVLPPGAWARPKPVTSTGFCARVKGGRTSASSSTVSGAKSGSSRPSSWARSAMMSQAPPEALTTPIRRPRSGGAVASSPAVTRSSSRPRARITPSCRRAASTTASSPATAPVCASAARRPAALRPTLSATMGLPASSALRARATKWADWRISSRKRAITRVAGSSIRYSITSAVVTIASLPMETSRLIPMAWLRAKASMALARAPLCRTRLTGPAIRGGLMVSP